MEWCVTLTVYGNLLLESWAINVFQQVFNSNKKNCYYISLFLFCIWYKFLHLGISMFTIHIANNGRVIGC